MSTRDKYQLNDLNTSTGLAVSGDAILRDGVCVVWRGGAVGIRRIAYIIYVNCDEDISSSTPRRATGIPSQLLYFCS
jgi:hypothetical protein